MEICNLPRKEFKIFRKLKELQENTKINWTKPGKQYMIKMRSLTEIEIIKKDQTEILELKNAPNE